MAPEYALDASALLAWLNGEEGGERVEPLLDRAVMPAVNLSETLQKSLAAGVGISGLREDLEALGLLTVRFTAKDAEIAARMWMKTGKLGLFPGRPLLSGYGYTPRAGGRHRRPRLGKGRR